MQPQRFARKVYLVVLLAVGFAASTQAQLPPACVRETVRFAWEHGGSSLLDSLSAEQDFRFVQLSYANLLGSYLAAVAQLNAAVGQEVIQ